MTSKRADKKNFSLKNRSLHFTLEKVSALINSKFKGLFRLHTKDSTQTALQYMVGLLRCEKGHENMERMTEKVEEADYKRYVHFLSVSKWSADDVNAATLSCADESLKEQKQRSGLPTALVLDETSHVKKGNKSVGVKRQYAGVVGKVENCQVSVHASLANEKFCTLVGSKLFLPEEWCNDTSRCQAAGIPKEHQVFKTKPQLALELVKQAVDAGVEFDFVGGDGLYGHNAELTRALDDLPVFYVLDVHKDETVFLSEPTFSVPQRKGIKGRTPTNRQPDVAPVQLQHYIKTLTDEDFTQEKVRKTAKGWKIVKVHTKTVWHWDGKEEKACKRTLVITVGDKTKYSLSNGEQGNYTNNEWAYFQCSRYWVERCFDDCKNELGMSGYQVTGWLAWHHHMALVLMASLYIMQLKLLEQDDTPLLSVRDARILIIAINFCTQKEVDMCIEQMNLRHRQRQADMDRWYKILI